MFQVIGIFLILCGVIMFIAGGYTHNLYGCSGLLAGGLITGYLGKLLISFGNKIEDEIIINEHAQQKEAFIANATAIKVDLTQCKIHSRDYYIERAHTRSEYNSYKYDPTNQWSGDMIREKKLNATVTFKTEINGQKREFLSPIIEKDNTTLRFILGHQQETYLYVNIDNPDLYLFDFDFIKEKYS